MSAVLVNVALLSLLALTALAVNQQRDLFATTMLMAIYSLLSASLFVCLDAADVAFTEAAVGAGIATILFLETLALTSARERSPVRVSLPGLAAVVLTGGLLVYGLADMPPFGAPDNPVQTYLAGDYITASVEEIGIPNLVTAILAGYRGYDTLGEVVVIFTAGIGVLLLLGRPAEARS